MVTHLRTRGERARARHLKGGRAHGRTPASCWALTARRCSDVTGRESQENCFSSAALKSKRTLWRHLKGAIKRAKAKLQRVPQARPSARAAVQEPGWILPPQVTHFRHKAGGTGGRWTQLWRLPREPQAPTTTLLARAMGLLFSAASRAGQDAALCPGVPKWSSGCSGGCSNGQERGWRGAAGSPWRTAGQAWGSGGGLASPSAGKGKPQLPEPPILQRRPSKTQSCSLAEGRASDVQSGEELFFTLIALELAE